MGPVAPGWPRPLRVAASGWPAAIAGLPLVTAAVVFRRWGLGSAAILEMSSIRGWGLACAGLLVAGIVGALVERRWALAMGLAGALSLLAHPVVDAALRVDAELAVGEGATTPAWLRKQAGPGAVVPEVEILGVSAVPGEVLRLRVDGEDFSIARVGDTASGRGATVRVKGIHPAPAFEIRDAAGTLLEGGFVEVGGVPDAYIEVPTLPHRFYFSEPARPPPGGVLAERPESLDLRIQRGKLRVFEGRLKAGEAARFEGIELRWQEGRRWLQVELTKRPRPVFLVAAAVLLLNAVVLSLVARRVAR